MAGSQAVASHIPYLRRYARALTGSQTTGDAFVRATLEAALADEDLKSSLDGGRVPLYRAFNSVWSSAYLEVASEEQNASEHEIGAQDRLGAITPLNRQALLLTTLEDFSAAQAAQVMGLDTSEVEALVAEAVGEIDREQATSVLIIEDEPLISMQLEDLVTAGPEWNRFAEQRGEEYARFLQGVDAVRPDLWTMSYEHSYGGGVGSEAEKHGGTVDARFLAASVGAIGPYEPHAGTQYFTTQAADDIIRRRAYAADAE